MALNLSGFYTHRTCDFSPGTRQRAPDYGVKVNLLQLDANENEAMIKAEWLVYRPTNGESVKRRISQLILPLPSGASEPEQVAEAYSKLLLQLSEIIAADIKEDQAAQ